MRAHHEDTPSAPRTETVPVLFGQAARFSRGMKRPDGGTWAGPPHTPLLSVTSSRNPYALIARSVLADQLIPDGALVLLAILASLHRGKRPLTLSAKELAASQGRDALDTLRPPPPIDGPGLPGRRRKAQTRVPAKRGQAGGRWILSRGSHVRARAPTSSGTGARRALGSL